MSGWIVGVDAGGTTSRALARHSGSGETRRAEAEGANWTVHGPAICKERLSELVGSVLPAGERLESLALCLAGFYPPDHAAEANAWASSEWPDSRTRIEPDYAAAWAGAFGGSPGIIVIAGTGSIAYGRNAAGEEARAGGWGPLFGDEGSAYWIGRRSLAIIAREEDQGRRPTETFLRLQSAFPELGVDRRSWLRGVYRHAWGREEVAALAAHLTDDLQCKSAARVLYFAGFELNNLARTVHLRLGKPAIPITLLGGVAQNSTAVRRAFGETLPAGTALVEPQSEPVAGALLLAQAALD